MSPEHALLWDNFRSIDLEKEAKVLQVRRVGGVRRGREALGGGWGCGSAHARLRS